MRAMAARPPRLESELLWSLERVPVGIEIDIDDLPFLFDVGPEQGLTVDRELLDQRNRAAFGSLLDRVPDGVRKLVHAYRRMLGLMVGLRRTRGTESQSERTQRHRYPLANPHRSTSVHA